MSSGTLLGFSQVGEFPLSGFECRYLNSTQTPLFGIYPISESFPAGQRESSLSFFRAGDSRKKAEHPWKTQPHQNHQSRGLLSLTMTTCAFSPSDAHIGQGLPASPRDSAHVALDITSRASSIRTVKRIAGITPSPCAHYQHQHNL